MKNEAESGMAVENKKIKVSSVWQPTETQRNLKQKHIEKVTYCFRNLDYEYIVLKKNSFLNLYDANKVKNNLKCEKLRLKYE